MNFQDFVGEYCRYEGDMLENFEFIPDEQICQKACLNYPGCEYFVYSKAEEDCKLLSKKDRICDLFRGFIEVSLEDKPECITTD